VLLVEVKNSVFTSVFNLGHRGLQLVVRQAGVEPATRSFRGFSYPISFWRMCVIIQSLRGSVSVFGKLDHSYQLTDPHGFNLTTGPFD
jgi:hypothetical protein